MFGLKDKDIINAIGAAAKKFLYYAPALMRTRVKADDKIDTMGINNRLLIKYNPTWFSSLDSDTKIALVTHEEMHVVSDHHHRHFVHPDKSILSPTLFNIAMDMEINQYLVKDCDWISREGWIPSKMNYPDGKSFEEYLSYMKSDIENDRQNNPNLSDGEKNDARDGKDGPVRQLRQHEDDYQELKDKINDALSKSVNELDMSGVEESDAEVSTELEELIQECIRNAQSKGIGSEHQITSITRSIPEKSYDWRTVLKSIILSKSAEIDRGRDRTTYTQINRRMSAISQDIVFPNKYSVNKTFSIVVGIDISGSMGDLTTEMYSRLKSIRRLTSSESHIITVECDTEVSSVNYDFKPYVNTIESNQGGGTDMEAIPRWVEKMVNEHKIAEPDMIIIMTDNYVNWEGSSKYKNKISVLTDNVTEDCPYKQYKVIIDDEGTKVA